MNDEQKAAYISSQVACATIEAMGMAAENAHRQANGLRVAYGEEAFTLLIDKYGISHNAVLTVFHAQ